MFETLKCRGFAPSTAILLVFAIIFPGPVVSRSCFDFNIAKLPNQTIDMSQETNVVMCESDWEALEVAPGDYCDYKARDMKRDHCYMSAIAVSDQNENVELYLYEGGCYYDRALNYCVELPAYLNQNSKHLRNEFCSVCYTDNCNNPSTIPRVKDLNAHLGQQGYLARSLSSRIGSPLNLIIALHLLTA